LFVTFPLYSPPCPGNIRLAAGVFAVLSTGTIVRIYAQGAEAVLRLTTKLEDRIADLEAQLTRSPQPVIASLMIELAQLRVATIRNKYLNTHKGTNESGP
jgi:hypothetical protein